MAALRIEGSNELEDEPALRGGPAVAWRVTKNASLTLEYPYSSYKSDLAEDSKGRELDSAHQVWLRSSACSSRPRPPYGRSQVLVPPTVSSSISRVG
jgi:hypothetical protein